MDVGDMAMDAAAILEATEFVRYNGWEVIGLDIGEIEITTGDGERFRFTVQGLEGREA